MAAITIKSSSSLSSSSVVCIVVEWSLLAQPTIVVVPNIRAKNQKLKIENTFFLKEARQLWIGDFAPGAAF